MIKTINDLVDKYIVDKIERFALGDAPVRCGYAKPHTSFSDNKFFDCQYKEHCFSKRNYGGLMYCSHEIQR